MASPTEAAAARVATSPVIGSSRSKVRVAAGGDVAVGDDQLGVEHGSSSDLQARTAGRWACPWPRHGSWRVVQFDRCAIGARQSVRGRRSTRRRGARSGRRRGAAEIGALHGRVGDRGAAPRRRRRCGRSRSGSRGRRCARLCRAFCSTSRTPTPVSRMLAERLEQLVARAAATGRARARRAAASPAPTSARGRSPPSAARRRSWCATAWPSRSLRRGNSASTRVEIRASRRGARGGIGAEQQVLAHRQLAEDAAPFRHQRDAGLDDLVRRQAAEVAAAERDRARRARCGTRPAIALSSVLLPAPLAPRMTTISPRPTLRSTSASARCLP